MRYHAAAGIATLALASAAQGVIIHGNQLERPDHAYVGVFRGGSAVAIGENLLLTAGHVGGERRSVFTLGEERFLAKSVTRHTSLDLSLIETYEPLPGWHEVTDELNSGDRVVLGGFGKVQGKKKSKGYKWSDDRSEVWGENIVNFLYNGYGFFDFDKRNGSKLEGEAIFSSGDSGGGVFIEQPDGTFQLAGIAIGVTGKIGFSRFGNLGVFLPVADALRDFDLTLEDTLVPEIAGPFDTELTETPAPGTLALMLGAGAIVTGRRRRG